MGRETLRAQMCELVKQINTLVVGATVEELQDIMAALSYSQCHVVTQLMVAKDAEIAARQETKFYTVREVAGMTGYSRSWLYVHGEALGIAVRPAGSPGLRFPKIAVELWMAKRECEA